MKPEAALNKSRRPEDVELSNKIEELERLQARVAELELQLLGLRLELAEFDKFYSSKVGPLYAELDELEALIAESIARSQPQNAEAAEAATNARKQAQESRTAASAAVASKPQPIRTESLKNLYRAVAKKLHPDLAVDDNDRKIRERLMTEANLAYERGDEPALKAVLEEYEGSPEAVVGNDTGAKLIRVIRQISLVNKRILQIEAEISDLMQSELYKLKTLIEDGKRDGRDILADMIERLRQQIQFKRKHLASL